MEGLISTIVFVLPGFILYFWIQMMGVNPVVKHTVAEFAALAALAWLPVTVFTLGIMSLFGNEVWTLEALRIQANDFLFIAEFLGISLVTSIILAFFYVKLLYPMQQWITNKVRVSINKTELSRSPSVWEEVFFNNDILIVGISKIGSPVPEIVGNIEKSARPFEQKRAIKLIYMDYVKVLIEKYKIPLTGIYTDIDAGVNVFIYDYEAYLKADQEERKDPIYIQTPSRSSTF